MIEVAPPSRRPGPASCAIACSDDMTRTRALRQNSCHSCHPSRRDDMNDSRLPLVGECHPCHPCHRPITRRPRRVHRRRPPSPRYRPMTRQAAPAPDQPVVWPQTTNRSCSYWSRIKWPTTCSTAVGSPGKCYPRWRRRPGRRFIGTTSTLNQMLGAGRSSYSADPQAPRQGPPVPTHQPGAVT